MPKTTTSHSRDALNEAFAEAVKDKPDLAAWLLAKTKFAPHAGQVRLLHAEQANIRPRKLWWRHWWCHVTELGMDRVTAIFMVFEHLKKPDLRFAVHIHTMNAKSRFGEGQAEAYAPKGIHMCGQARFLDHSDFTTALIAHPAFISGSQKHCAFFDVTISYKEVAAFVPEFHA